MDPEELRIIRQYLPHLVYIEDVRTPLTHLIPTELHPPDQVPQD